MAAIASIQKIVLWSEQITCKNLCYLIVTMRLDTRLNFKRHLYDLYWKTASQLRHKCTSLASFKSDFDIFNFFRWFWICFSCLFCSSFTHFLVTLYSVSWSIVFKRRNYWHEVYLIIFQWKKCPSIRRITSYLTVSCVKHLYAKVLISLPQIFMYFFVRKMTIKTTNYLLTSVRRYISVITVTEIDIYGC